LQRVARLRLGRDRRRLRRLGGRSGDGDRRWGGGWNRAGSREHRCGRARSVSRARARASCTAAQQSDHDDDQQQADQRRVKPAQVAGPWLGPVACLARRPSAPPAGGAEAEPLSRRPSALQGAAAGPAAQPTARRPLGGGSGLDLERLRCLAPGRRLGWGNREVRNRRRRGVRCRLRDRRPLRLRLDYGRGLGDGRGVGRRRVRLVGKRLWPLLWHGAAARARRWLRGRRCQGGERLRKFLR